MAEQIEPPQIQAPTPATNNPFAPTPIVVEENPPFVATFVEPATPPVVDVEPVKSFNPFAPSPAKATHRERPPEKIFASAPDPTPMGRQFTTVGLKHTFVAVAPLPPSASTKGSGNPFGNPSPSAAAPKVPYNPFAPAGAAARGATAGGTAAPREKRAPPTRTGFVDKLSGGKGLAPKWEKRWFELTNTGYLHYFKKEGSKNLVRLCAVLPVCVSCAS
jgi:hypothetical protein